MSCQNPHFLLFFFPFQQPTSRPDAPDVLVIPTGDNSENGGDCEDTSAHVTVETTQPSR